MCHLFELREFYELLSAVCDDTQNLNETESETFSDTKFFPIPNPILFSIPNFFDTESDIIQKIGKDSKLRSFENEMSHAYNVLFNYKLKGIVHRFVSIDQILYFG